MSLDFLSVSAGGLPARSPLADARFGGAVLEQRDGWEIVATYGDPAAEERAIRATVGWADVSDLSKADLGAPSPWLESFEQGVAVRRGEGWCCPLTPRRGLLLGETGAPQGGTLLDLSCSLGAISIAGPRAGETIARFCAIDTRPSSLPEGGFRPGSVARTPGYLLREGGDSFLLLFGAAFGSFMWGVVSDAGRRLGGRPVGADALRGRTPPVGEVSVRA